MNGKLKQYIYYIVIGGISFFVLLVFPFLGSQVNGIGYYVPKGTIEWAIFLVTRFLIAVVNVLIFDSFIKQAKVNIKEDARYKEARMILLKEEKKARKPRGPAKFFGGEYGKKGATIFITSAASAVILGEVILNYDYSALISYATVVVFGLVFGVLEMKKVEEYWTEEYHEYALMVKTIREEAEKEKENDKDRQHPVPQHGGTNPEEQGGHREPSASEQPIGRGGCEAGGDGIVLRLTSGSDDLPR